MKSASFEFLDKINFPQDLRKFDKKDLKNICEDLRNFIINSISKHGGHFGASLGVVELTVALHYVYNTPDDMIVWDVGHQAYGHKILTGRKDIFYTNRVYKGLSGFPKISESEYDTFGVGHSSTSISAALGMAVASKYQGYNERQHIAVIGDGGMTGGISFEGMNHAGDTETNITIILNDNCMSIDPNVGALKKYLTDISTSPTFNNIRDDIWKVLGKLNKVGESARNVGKNIEKSLKSFVLDNSNLFEALNLRYFGPIDGHDINHLVKTLEYLKRIPGPKLLHCITKKGKGYSLAEKNQTKWHATGKFDVASGKSLIIKKKEKSPPKYQDVFGNTIVELAKINDKIMGITPAMPSGSSLNIMMNEMPQRAFDVGIAEQHAVTFSAGLATKGLIPFCNIYSTFMQRAFDQVIHDVCIQNLPVIFCLDRAGIAGSDGPTHHGAYDLAYMRCLPNMIVSAPMNESELRNLMYTAQNLNKHPFTIRYPRGKGVMIEWKTKMELINIGEGRIICEGNDIAILSIGHIGNYVTKAINKLRKENIYPSHYDMRFVKPLDEKLLHRILEKHKFILTVEDGCVMGGFGSAILEFISDNNYKNSVQRLGIPDRVIEHGSQEELYVECNYDDDAIYRFSKKMLNFKNTSYKEVII
ncbi:MAG: 1-deoxy-D-xylulose-5-phosphate synthase [Bacteroidota bacterium]|nr:1-deoxy-D-xylulose-5-phosphate synthase [Bacteroidota bacterium]